VERIQDDPDKADRTAIRDADEYVAFDVRADRPYRLGLIGLPVGMQAKKDRVAERVTDRREDGFPTRVARTR
jgi:hypothetical protein